jgi:Protein of unknown function with HXXEE motif
VAGLVRDDPLDLVRGMSGRLARGLLVAPLILVAHFLEEGPGFVAWFNAHVSRGITEDLFWTVNVSGLVITVFVTLLFWTTRSQAAELLVVAWLSCLMLTNAVFHITGAILDRGYVPGLPDPVSRHTPVLEDGNVVGSNLSRLEGPLLVAPLERLRHLGQHLASGIRFRQKWDVERSLSMLGEDLGGMGRHI